MSEVQLIQRINQLEKRLSLLETQERSGNFTQGSVLFANANGNAAQDNANLFYDDTTNSLTVGGNIDGASIGDVGTWTPVLRGTGTAGTFTYNVQTGRYYRFGKLVIATGRIDISAISVAPTLQIRIGGLPFTVLNGNGVGTVHVGYLSQFNMATAGAMVQGLPLNNTTDIVLYESSDNTNAAIALAAGINATFAIIFTAFYVAA